MRRKVTRRPKRRSRVGGKTVANIVKKTIRQMSDKESEFKYFDKVVEGATLATTGTVYPLTEVPSGDTIITRDGNEITLRSIQIRLRVQGTTTDAVNLVRVILLRVLSQDTSDPTVATAAETDVLTVSDVYGMRSLGSTKNRYIIMWDKVIKSDIPNVTTERNLDFRKYFKKWKNGIKISYASSTTDQPVKNSLYLIVLSTSTSTNGLYFQSRIRFLDK